MRVIMSILFTAVVLFASNAVAAPAGSEGLSVQLEAPETVEVGDTISLKVTVTNDGTDTMILREPKFDASSIDFNVWFEDGDKSRYTKYPRDPRMKTSTLPGVDLAAGESLSLEHEVVAVKVGEWKFQANCRGGSSGSGAGALSETVTVTVQPKDEVTQMLWEMNTDQGTMRAEFWPEVAPATTLHISNLVNDGFYDGTVFHRAIQGFMIQGGDPDGNGTGGPGFCQQAEFNKRKHVAGVLSMTRSQSPNSAGSQFFLMHGVAPHLDGQYTGYGKLVSGMKVLDAIATAPVGPNPMSREMSSPKSPVKIENAKLVKEARGS